LRLPPNLSIRLTRVHGSAAVADGGRLQVVREDFRVVEPTVAQGAGPERCREEAVGAVGERREDGRVQELDRDAGRDRLPGPLRSWLRAEAGRPWPRAFATERDGRRLVVCLVERAPTRRLLLEERPSARPPASLDGLGLTAREGEVLGWAADGKTNEAIATILGLSVRTVHKHLEHVYEKLGVETRTAAAARAYERLALR
jgi:DNA-binding CsgD family transcriptional regulator